MNAFQSALSSNRFNRIMLWFGAAVLALGTAVLVNTLAGGSDKTSTKPEAGFKPQLPVNSKPLANAQGQRIDRFEQLDPAVRQTIRTFLATAVARKHLDQSWAVIAPSLRVGFTYQQWKHADALPVVPYPIANVDKANYYLSYASTKEIMVEVGLSAPHRLKVHPTAFQLALNPVGRGAHIRWLVSYWMPRWTPPLPLN